MQNCYITLIITFLYEIQRSLRLRNPRNESEACSTSLLSARHSFPNTNTYYKERYQVNRQSNIMPYANVSREQSTNKRITNPFSCENDFSDNSVSCNHNNVTEDNPNKTMRHTHRKVHSPEPKTILNKNDNTNIAICDSFSYETEKETKELIKESLSITTDKVSLPKVPKMATTTEVEPAPFTLSKVNESPPKDQQKLVQDMRRTLGPNFATMGLMMAARSQVDCFSTQIGITGGEGDEDGQDSQENDTFFFQEIYTPFMEVLIKGNSGMSKINDHARTVPPCERCFFCLLILVTLIYGVGILTAVALLSSMMWFT